MVYTQARLDDALRVFRLAAVLRDKKGLASEKLERHLRSGYALRKKAQAAPLVTVTWREKDSSDDEEYDPFNDNRKPAKRKVEKKRKAEDAGDAEKVVKKMKDSHSSDAFCATVADASCLILKLVSEAGRELLKNIGTIRCRVEIDPEAESSDDEGQPSYFSRYASSKKKKQREDAWNTLELGREWMGSDLEDTLVGPGRRLRNGKTLQQKVKEEKKKQKQKHKHDYERSSGSRPAFAQSSFFGQTSLPVKSKDQDLRSIFSTAQPVTKKVPEIGTSDHPISLDDSSDDQAPQTSLARPLQSLVRKAQPTIKQEYPLSPVSLHNENFTHPRLAARSPVPTQSYTHEPGILTITTSYAHPIDFKHSPTPLIPCDFCTDFRMSILGLSTRRVEVFIDPDSPNQYQEIGNGHRSEGRDCTRMCVKCALNRLLIMRCHDTHEDGGIDRVSGERTVRFTKIRGLVTDGNTINAYVPHLFGRSEGKGVDMEKPLLPTCSLCYSYAVVECCRWQRTDAVKRTRVVPGLEGGEKLLPMKAGCGLKLCLVCRKFVEEQCGGKLEKRKVMRWLKAGIENGGNRFGARADVEWLFKGSMLDRCYAAGGGRR